MATATLTDTTRNLEEILHDLGGITPGRVRFRVPFAHAVEADLIAFNDRREGVHELVDGLLVAKAIGYNESALSLALACDLRAFIVPRNLGVIAGAGGMMRLLPGLVRIPDVSYTSWDRIPGRRLPTDPVAGFAPDLAVQVLRRGNTKAEMARKRREYFETGVRLVWEVDPVARTVAVFDAPDRSSLLDQSQILDGGDVLPGFTLSLALFFGELDRQGN